MENTDGGREAERISQSAVVAEVATLPAKPVEVDITE